MLGPSACYLPYIQKVDNLIQVQNPRGLRRYSISRGFSFMFLISKCGGSALSILLLAGALISFLPAISNRAVLDEGRHAETLTSSTSASLVQPPPDTIHPLPYVPDGEYQQLQGFHFYIDPGHGGANAPGPLCQTQGTAGPAGTTEREWTLQVRHPHEEATVEATRTQRTSRNAGPKRTNWLSTALTSSICKTGILMNY